MKERKQKAGFSRGYNYICRPFSDGLQAILGGQKSFNRRENTRRVSHTGEKQAEMRTGAAPYELAGRGWVLHAPFPS